MEQNLSMIPKAVLLALERYIASTLVVWFVAHNILPVDQKDAAVQVITSLIEGVIFVTLVHYSHSASGKVSGSVDIFSVFKGWKSKIFVTPS